MPYPFGAGGAKQIDGSLRVPGSGDVSRPKRERAEIKSRLDLIKRSLADGENYTQIATRLGCSYQGVYNLVARLKKKGEL